jgi:hypothetical protein
MIITTKLSITRLCSRLFSSNNVSVLYRRSDVALRLVRRERLFISLIEL